MTLADIALRLNGRLEGDGSLPLRGVAGIREARAGEISFVAGPRYAAAAAETKASALVVPTDWSGPAPANLIRVPKPDEAIGRVAEWLAPPAPPAPPPGVHASAVVDTAARLGKDVSVGPCAVIEAGATIGERTVIGAGVYVGHDCAIGADCRLYPHVSVRERVRMGNRCIVHNGAVIGSDGFGYNPRGERWEKIPQTGTVEIGDDVEIGANTTIDRARLGRTVIGNGVKIDNLVQIAHNVQVGDHTAMAAQVGISGSTAIGRHVQLAGQAGVVGHITIGDNAVVGGQAGVTKDVAPATFVSGYPAMPHGQARVMHAHMMRLPNLKEKVEAIEHRLRQLEQEGTEEKAGSAP